uniref:Dysbindin domain containing 2 n=1 Tax=Naja naja TaxID=35670 RepID=A0A8C6VJB4_NAJNA
MYFYTIVRPRAQSCMQQQQLKLWERQRFFEEVFQHDVDFFFPVSHLQIEHRRPPLGSISSMEVNVDMLEQMDMLDLSDQDTVDVFLSCGTEDNNNVATLLPGMERVGNLTKYVGICCSSTGPAQALMVEISMDVDAMGNKNNLEKQENGGHSQAKEVSV